MNSRPFTIDFDNHQQTTDYAAYFHGDYAFADRWSAGQELVIPIKHGEGSWYGDAVLLAALEDNGQIAFRYTEDVNGALGRVAGVTNEAGNVLGLMPHPEHAVDPLLGPTGGVAVLEGLIAAAHKRTPAVA